MQLDWSVFPVLLCLLNTPLFAKANLIYSICNDKTNLIIRIHSVILS